MVLRILFQSHSTAKMLQLSEKVNPRSDVTRNADVGLNANGKHQEKRTFREEYFAFINSLQNMTQKNQKFPQEPTSVREIKKRSLQTWVSEVTSCKSKRSWR